MANRMRLCIATSSYPSQSGNSFAGVFVREFAKELRRREIEVSIFTQNTGFPPVQDEGIEVITFPWPGKSIPLSSLRFYRPSDILSSLLLLRRGTRRLLQHAYENQIDFLLAMWVLPAGQWGMKVQRCLGVPLAVWSLGSDIWIYGRLPILKWWIRRILKKSKYCFADGFSLAEEAALLGGRPCSFLPTTRTLPQEGLPEVSLQPDKVHYLFVGRYHRNKGPDLLLEAVHGIDRAILSGMHFHFFGMGPLEEALRRRVSEYGLEDDVTIGGPVDEYTLAALLRGCRCLVIPSRIESIPVILSDALQLDCNLIVSDVGDMGSLVRRFRAGIVVEKATPEGLQEALLGQLRRGNDEFKEGREKLYALFDLKRSVDTFLQTIRS